MKEREGSAPADASMRPLFIIITSISAQFNIQFCQGAIGYNHLYHGAICHEGDGVHDAPVLNGLLACRARALRTSTFDVLKGTNIRNPSTCPARERTMTFTQSKGFGVQDATANLGVLVGGGLSGFWV